MLETFERMQRIIKIIPIERIDCPIGITISASGNFLVKYSFSSPKSFTGIHAAIEEINLALDILENT